jgi:hypothetical protein
MRSAFHPSRCCGAQGRSLPHACQSGSSLPGRPAWRPSRHGGQDKAAYDTVVIRNVKAATQVLNVQKGDSRVALDLSGDQVKGLDTSSTGVGCLHRADAAAQPEKVRMLMSEDREETRICCAC